MCHFANIKSILLMCVQEQKQIKKASRVLLFVFQERSSDFYNLDLTMSVKRQQSRLRDFSKSPPNVIWRRPAPAPLFRARVEPWLPGSRPRGSGGSPHLWGGGSSLGPCPPALRELAREGGWVVRSWQSQQPRVGAHKATALN